MALVKEVKTELVKGFQQHDKDTGSPEVQIAILTNRSLARSQAQRCAAASHRPDRPVLRRCAGGGRWSP